ncbi:MAG: Na+/H+ antiporter NhaA, partial [Pseudomonadales bacterium]
IGLKVFLTALAIADDLMAVGVIAVFYTPRLDVGTLLLAAIPMVLMVILNKARVRAVWVYALMAFFVWISVLGSGVHATIAGVMVAMVIPVRPVIDPAQFLKVSSELLAALRGPDNSLEALIHDAGRREKLEQLELTVEDAIPPAIKLEHSLHPLQSFIILPLFALFSAGVTFDAEILQGFPTGASLGVIVGLVLGKPIGVMCASLLVLRFSKVELSGVTVKQLFGAGCLAGIGFTMSIFISELAWSDPYIIDQAKVGILIASVLAGIIGGVVLHLALPSSAADTGSPERS